MGIISRLEEWKNHWHKPWREAYRLYSMHRPGRSPRLCYVTTDPANPSKRKRTACCEMSMADEYFRCLTYADDIIRINHQGWFCEPHRGSTYRGVVVTARGRHKDRLSTVMYAGYEDSFTDQKYLVVDLSISFDDRPVAARAADQMARRDAESSMEIVIKDEAENRSCEIDAEIEEIKTALAAIDNEAHKTICQIARGRINSLTSERKRIKDNPYSLFE